MDVQELQPIVIDNGSYTCKAGFASDNVPRAVFPSIVGHPPRESLLQGLLKHYYVGEEAMEMASRPDIDMLCRRPVEGGLITIWDDMEGLWHHLFHHQLKVAPEEHPILLSEPPLSPRSHREKVTQVMFECFNVPAVNIAPQPLLSLYAAGWTSGLVLDCGYNTITATPFHDGKVAVSSERPLTDVIRRLDYGGKDLTDYLASLIAERGDSSSSSSSSSWAKTASSERQVLNSMKEQLCYVAPDFKEELKLAATNITSFERSYENFTLDNERFRCPELLFRSSLLLGTDGDREDGIQDIVFNSVMKSSSGVGDEPLQIRKELLGNVLLSGGSSLFPGMAARLQNELKEKVKAERMEVKVVAPVDRRFAAWMGGSILASLPPCHQRWVEQKDYDEVGPRFAPFFHKSIFVMFSDFALLAVSFMAIVSELFVL
ncbi:Structural maintenance of chromosomes protein 3 [Balamuthia mandrillaris]